MFFSGRSSQSSPSNKNEVLPVSLVDPVWELIDPIPDVHALFCTFNDQFFWGKLHAVSVSWSPRMTVLVFIPANILCKIL